MLSKEEIEKAKEDFKFFNEGDYITKEAVNSKEKIFEYIEQLESDKQKLIEKLEKENKEDTDTVKNFERQYRNSVDEGDKRSYKRNIDMANARREVRKQILEIVKGEKK